MKVATGAALAAGATTAAAVMPWPDIFKGVLGAGGVPPALFLLVVGGLVAALFWALNALAKEQAARDVERVEAAKAANEIQEKRIEEGKAMLLALERTATALTTHEASLASTETNLNALVQGVAVLGQGQEATREHFKGVAERLESGVANITKMLRGE